MKIKNGKLIGVIEQTTCLADLKMPGIVSLSVTKNRKRFIEAYKTFEETRQQLLESRTAKGEDGKPLTVPATDSNNEPLKNKDGSLVMKYKFETPEIEKEAIDEVQKLENVEVELTLDTIDHKILENIECSPTQMEAILSLLD